jgi:DNA-binding SARP family transcriptional activator/tetratricopeptide (TPR) repeat protein
MTLGRFELRVDGRPVPHPPTKKARALTAFLVSREGRDVSREQLTEIFWPETDPESARRSLNTALSSVRTCLRSSGLDGTQLLYGDKSVVRWTARSSVDHLRLSALAERPSAANAEEALELYGGEFLEGDYDEWAVGERTRISQDFETILASAVRSHKNVRAAKALVAFNPFDETAQELLIESELLAGRRGVAAALADRCRRVFAEAQLELSPAFVRRFGGLGEPSREPAVAAPLRFEPDMPGEDRANGISEPVFCRKFIGREMQLDALLQRLNAAHEGSGSTVLIAGEAGIGKTRIVRELRAYCGDETSFAVGQSVEHAPSPFAPFAEALRALHRDAPRLLAEQPALAAALAPFVPDLEAAAMAGERDERRVMDAFADAFVLFARERTTVLIFEDLQWADAASLRLLLRLQDRLAASRLLIVATYRVGEPEEDRGLAAAISEIGRSMATWRILLRPLDRRLMTELVREAAHESPRISQNTMSEVVARAEGNPLFAEELLRAALESGSDAVPLAPTVQAAVSERLHHLSGDQRRLLVLASAAGRRFSPEVVAAVAGRSVGDVLAAIREAVGLQLLDDEGGAQYAFHHALIHDAVYAELMSGERRQLHAHFLDVLEAGSPASRNPEELARHAWEARDLPKVAIYAELAAEAALRVEAYEDASRLLRNALATDPAPPTRAKLLGQLAYALFNAGDAVGAIAAIEPVIKFYRSCGEPVQEARALLAAHRYYHDDATELVRGLEAVQRAFELLEAQPDPDRAELFGALVNLSELMLHRQAAPGVVEAVLERAEALPGERRALDLQRFYQYRACARATRGDISGCRLDFAKSRETAREAGDYAFVVVSLCNECLRMMQYGQTERVIETVREFGELIGRHNVGDRVRAIARSMQAWAASEYGDFRGAREFIRGYLSAEFSAPFIVDVAFSGIGMPIGLRLGDDELVRALAKPRLVERAFAAGVVQNIPFVVLAFVELHLGRGEHELAAGLLHRALEVICPSPMDGSDHFPFLYVQAAAWGHSEDVRRARERLAHYAQNELFVVARAHLALFDAYAADRANQPQARAAQAHIAIRRFQSVRLPHYQALAHELAGETAAAIALHRSNGNVRDVKRLEGRSFERPESSYGSLR